MHGKLPPLARRYQVSDGQTVREDFAPREPAAHEVVVEVAGLALGAFPGSEVSGRVVATGDAAHDWLGVSVVVPRRLPCGECDRCRRGRVAACDKPAGRGAPATHEVLPARYLVSAAPPLLPVGVSLAELSIFADAMALPYAAIVRAEVAANELCVILGGGAYAAAATALVRALGAHALVLSADAGAEAAFGELGARSVVSSDLDLTRLRARIGEELRAIERPEATPKVLETTGTRAARRLAVGLAADGGCGVLLAAPIDGKAGAPVSEGCELSAESPAAEMSADLADLAAGEGTVVGVAACHPDLYPELLAIFARAPLERGVRAIERPMDEYAQALARSRGGAGRVMQILVPER